MIVESKELGLIIWTLLLYALGWFSGWGYSQYCRLKDKTDIIIKLNNTKEENHEVEE